MTALVHWLTIHHMPYGIVSGTRHHQHLVYVAFHAHCQNVGKLTGWADYGRKIVAYCYSK